MMRNLNHFIGTEESKTSLDIDQKQLQEYLKTFDLNDFGKNGITLVAEEEQNLPYTTTGNQTLIGAVNFGYYRHPVHVK